MKNRHLLLLLVVLCAASVVFGVATLVRQGAYADDVERLEGELEKAKTEAGELRDSLGKAQNQTTELGGELKTLKDKIDGLSSRFTTTQGTVNRFKEIEWLRPDAEPPWERAIGELKQAVEEINAKLKKSEPDGEKTSPDPDREKDG